MIIHIPHHDLKKYSISNCLHCYQLLSASVALGFTLLFIDLPTFNFRYLFCALTATRHIELPVGPFQGAKYLEMFYEHYLLLQQIADLYKSTQHWQTSMGHIIHNINFPCTILNYECIALIIITHTNYILLRNPTVKNFIMICMYTKIRFSKNVLVSNINLPTYFLLNILVLIYFLNKVHNIWIKSI
ncbi:hypothetical protein AGLY_009237 [Aphis glycines]|uniref:Uncharacterized protein n=1 Tax=Aphis glycines TaxID=307491 RepID=A0A6G0TI39_APHGL|nr:hypothetical protein AGLY_009237 [Aphis glycines]